jgi:dihydrolipoamide dehydrogenase
VIVATGSNARELPGAAVRREADPVEHRRTGHRRRAGKLGVIGAGVIGLEMGSVWRRLGAKVTVLEGLPTFLGAVDEQIAKEAHKLFTKQGLDIHLGVKIGNITKGEQRHRGIRRFDRRRADRHLRPPDRLDRPRAEHHRPGLRQRRPAARRARLHRRRRRVPHRLPGVWAVGDVVRGPMLAHKAEEEGVAVAERIAGQHGHVNFNTIPWVIYTSPEIAWVGRPSSS